MDKTIWTDNDVGDKIILNKSLSDSEEGRYVSSNIFELKNNSNGSNTTSFPNGNHGIGITTPTEKLQVAGNISASGDLTVNNINGTINGGTF